MEYLNEWWEWLIAGALAALAFVGLDGLALGIFSAIAFWGLYALKSIWFLIMSGRLFPLIGGLIAKLVQGAWENKQLNLLNDSRRLPKLHVPSSAKEVQMLASMLTHRLNLYEEVFRQMKAPFHGPYAISYRLAVHFRPEFIKHLDLRKRDLADLAKLMDKYMNLISDYSENFAAEVRQVQNRINGYEQVIERLNIRIKAYGLKRFNAVNWQQWRNIRHEVKKCAKRKKLAQKRLHSADKRRKSIEKKVFAGYQERIVLLAMRMIQLDEQRMRHAIHELAADFETNSSKVHSGGMFDDLIVSKDSEATEARQLLCLPKNFPLDDVRTAKQFMSAYLKGRVPLSNTPAREDLLECFLRAWVLDNSTQIFEDQFLKSLPRPGAMGLAQEKYHHYADGRSSWLRTQPQPRDSRGRWTSNKKA